MTASYTTTLDTTDACSSLPLERSAMAGRKPFVRTDEQRRMTFGTAGFGVPHDDIARVVRCSPPTLRKWFRHELDVATIEANARVAQPLFQQATTPGNIAASIFCLKARAGWREKQAVEIIAGMASRWCLCRW